MCIVEEAGRLWVAGCGEQGRGWLLSGVNGCFAFFPADVACMDGAPAHVQHANVSPCSWMHSEPRRDLLPLVVVLPQLRRSLALIQDDVAAYTPAVLAQLLPPPLRHGLKEVAVPPRCEELTVWDRSNGVREVRRAWCNPTVI